MPRLIKRTLTKRVLDDGYVVLSTETPVDQDGLILKAEGWDLSRGKPSFKMFYNHAFWGRDDTPIGRWDDVKVEGDLLVGKPVFASAEDPDRAARIERLWNNNFLDDISVTFSVDPDALEAEEVDGKEYQASRNHTLIEPSIVAIGADQEAGKGRLEEAITRGIITEEEAKVLCLTDDDATPPDGELAEVRINDDGEFERVEEEESTQSPFHDAEGHLIPQAKGDTKGTMTVNVEVTPELKEQFDKLYNQASELRGELDAIKERIGRLESGTADPDPDGKGKRAIDIESIKLPEADTVSVEAVRKLVNDMSDKSDEKLSGTIREIIKAEMDYRLGKVPQTRKGE